MDIKKRLVEVTQKFEQLKAEREGLINRSEEVLTEMTKLQGEFRVLNDMKSLDYAKSKKEKTNA